MSYTVWISNYSNEQLMPSFPWLWLAKVYAKKTSCDHPDNIVEVLDQYNVPAASFKDGKQL